MVMVLLTVLMLFLLIHLRTLITTAMVSATTGILTMTMMEFRIPTTMMMTTMISTTVMTSSLLTPASGAITIATVLVITPILMTITTVHLITLMHFHLIQKRFQIMTMTA